MDTNTMEINKTTPTLKIQQATNSLDAKVANIVKHSVNPAKIDVYIGDAQLLNEANEKLSEMSEVDMDKVNQVKQAIRDGEITFNLASLSQAIADEHLLGNGNDE